MVMSQVQSRNATVRLVPVQWFTVCISGDGCSVMSCFCMSLCMVQRAHSPLPPLSLCLCTASPRAEPACWTVEFLSFGGVLIQLALFSSGTDYVWISTPHPSPPLPFSWKQCIVDLDRSVCSTQLFCDGGMSGLTFPIWLVFRGRALLAGISNHRYRGWTEAVLTCCISHTPLPLTACML